MSRFDESLAPALQQAAESALRYRRELHGGPQCAAEDYAAQLARWDTGPLPAQGLAAQDVIRQLEAHAAPGLHATAGGRFFGWVTGGSHPVGVAADWLTSAWGQNGANLLGAPAAAASEAVAARWLLQLLGLPGDCSVGFASGATMANFIGLAAARSALLARVGWDVEADGLFGAPPVTVLIGEEGHATVYAALQFLGLGQRRVRRVRARADGGIDNGDFERALAEADGPVLAILQAGHLHTGAFDDFTRLIPRAHERGAWVHVDGAFGLWARACPSKAALAAGVERADSWATDGHKWLQLPYDSGFAIVRDAEAHRRAMTAAASYLPAAAAHERDPTHYVPELSRRARGFAAWALLRHLGTDGVAAMVERHCALARQLAELLARERGVTVLNDVVLNQVLVRFGDEAGAGRGGEEADALAAAVIERVQRDGVCFAGGTRWQGRWVMRLSVIGFSTDADDIRRSAEAISSAWRAVRPGG
ncbi:pyridoxal phosphate-dependent decarboxylase family protein [Azohydromonas aeria]|uniref:pyridoxal phosphate-dependent decarboxylase family protein n=1 Tax=Azohydromonas aeria TaxID=2590212 RepID=UPI0012F8BB75|nr:pyridoxal-dependent decarboxylase [Azohydromonas aeria]